MPKYLQYPMTLLLLIAAAFSTTANAGAGEFDTPKVKATLIAPTRSVVPGKPLSVGIRQVIEKDWHTYWKNPGDSGLPTRVTWELPEGFTASDISWPIPEALPYGPLVNYGYAGEVLLPVTITPPDTIDTRVVTLKAKAEWLVCKDICIPESAELEIKLPVAPAGAEGLPSRYAKVFENAQRKRATPSPWPVIARVDKNIIALRIEAPELKPNHVKSLAFFPSKPGPINHAAPQIVTWTAKGPQLTTNLTEPIASIDEFKNLDGVLIVTEDINGETVRNGFTVTAPVSLASPGELQTISPAQSDNVAQSGISLWQAMLFAAIGGMILNLMPCVLPILSLKVMSLARHGGEHGGAQAKASGLWYLAGVLISFAALAVLIIALKSAGAAMGWGFQFQSPTFVLVMAGLFFMLGLSLSGVFDIATGLEGTGGFLTRDTGPRGSFFTGALATIAATPCTAPFMGAAIGYALTRPAIELFVVLQALGLGFALPMLALSYSGAAAKLLPKPGPWMETLKQVLAFPLYATVAWLVWVISHQSGSAGVLAAAIVLVALGFIAWMIGQSRFAFSMRAGIAALIALIALATALPLLETKGINAGTGTTAAPTKSANAFSLKRLDELRANGHPVFVNFTAAWCISCKLNERLALNSTRFHDAMKEKNVVYLKGDWTLQDPEITRVLKSFGRSGVPLYVLYPADKNEKAIVLPQLLTEGIVLSSLEKIPAPPAH